jgi:hypothetical protein
LSHIRWKTIRGSLVQGCHQFKVNRMIEIPYGEVSLSNKQSGFRFIGFPALYNGKRRSRISSIAKRSKK